LIEFKKQTNWAATNSHSGNLSALKLLDFNPKTFSISSIFIFFIHINSHFQILILQSSANAADAIPDLSWAKSTEQKFSNQLFPVAAKLRTRD
jgi:hypothetical protein